MEIVFAGTPRFAADVLDGLLRAGHRVLAVLTQPDRPSGRGRKVTPGPVKRLAAEHGLVVHQPTSLRDPQASRTLEALAPDVLAVAAYGLLLPPRVLAIPRHGCINVHASLLPRWRGAAPVQRAVEAGDRETGVCIMRMDEGLDTGPVLLRRRCPIDPAETAGELEQRLATLGRDALLDALGQIARGSARETPQDAAGVTYAERVRKSEARVDWSADADLVARRVHAFNPTPGAWCELPPRTPEAPVQRLRLLRACALPGGRHGPPGQVLAANAGELRVACGRGRVELLEVQPAGRRAMSAAEFLNAGRLGAGDRLR